MPDPKVLWILFALPKALWLSRKCDVIYSSVSPYSAHVLALIVKKLTGKPWVADYRDEWTLNSQWFPNNAVHRWIAEKLDRACVHNATFVLNTTDARTYNFRKKYSEQCPDKFITLANGYDNTDMEPYRLRTPVDNPLTFISIGSLYGGRDPSLLLDAMAVLIEKGDIDPAKIRVNIVGAGNFSISNYGEHSKVLRDIVEVLPRIPQQEVFGMLADSHIAILIGSDMEKVAMPTKIYEYAGMGKRILAFCPDGEVADFTKKVNGWHVPAGDNEQMIRCLEMIYNDFMQGQRFEIYGDSYVEQFERKKLTGQLAGLLDSLVVGY